MVSHSEITPVSPPVIHPRESPETSQDVEIILQNMDPSPLRSESEGNFVRPSRTIPHGGFKVMKGLRIRPLHILSICWRSSTPASKIVALLWPLVPAALAVKYAREDLHLATFILSYIAMVPCANLIGFASRQVTRKLHKVLGHLIETILTSTPEMILLLTLLIHKEYTVIQAAVLGSILATLLLCLGICFSCGGLIYSEQRFHPAVSELGNDLLLTAGMGLLIAGAYQATHQDVSGSADKILVISRVAAILLMVSYLVYVDYQLRTHHQFYEVLLEEEENKVTRKPNLHKENKLGFAESIVSLCIGLTLVTMLAINLVDEIPYIVKERGVAEQFLGLILVPIVEKSAEHISTVEDALDDHMTAVLSDILGSTIQTAMFNTPLVVLVGWAINRPLDLSFKVFNMVCLILAILVIGSFCKDQRSNYLEGSLCLIVYLLIAVGSFFDE